MSDEPAIAIGEWSDPPPPPPGSPARAVLAGLQARRGEWARIEHHSTPRQARSQLSNMARRIPATIQTRTVGGINSPDGQLWARAL